MLQYLHACSFPEKKKISRNEKSNKRQKLEYRPDVAPLNYHLFRSLAPFLCSLLFSYQDNVKDSVKEFFKTPNTKTNINVKTKYSQKGGFAWRIVRIWLLRIYFLFRCMAPFIYSGRFSNKEEVKVSVKEFFARKDKKWCQRGIKDMVAERWLHPTYIRDWTLPNYG